MNKNIIAFVAQGLLAMVLFSSTPVAVKLVSADPMTIGFIRLGIAVVFGYFVLLKKDTLLKLSKKDWLWLFVLGFSFGIHWLAYFYSIKIGSASIAVVGVSTYGVQIVLISMLLHGRPFYPTDAIAIAIVLLGNFLIIPEFSLDNNMTRGFLIGVVSAFFYAVLPSIHQQNSHMDAGTRSFGQFLFAGVFFALFLPKMNFSMSSFDWLGMLYLGGVVTLVGHTLWIRFTTHVSAVPASLIYYLSVPLAILLSVIVLNEPLTWQIVLGTICILLGNVLGILHQIKSNSFFIRPESHLDGKKPEAILQAKKPG